MSIFDLFTRRRITEVTSFQEGDAEAVRITEQVNPTMMATSAPQHPDWYWYFCRSCSNYVLSTLAHVEHLCYTRGVNIVLPRRVLAILPGRGYVCSGDISMDSIRPRDAKGKFLASSLPKPCVLCGETDPAKFYYHASGRRNGVACKSCRKDYYAASMKQHNLRQRFGMTLSEYKAMLEAQGGVCAICKQPETAMGTHGRKVRALAVDHDHETGKIRQLLCASCNYLLGYVKEDSDLLQAASEYLKRHKA